jgi:proteasome assembly chaperone (PAC2) family protein
MANFKQILEQLSEEISLEFKIKSLEYKAEKIRNQYPTPVRKIKLKKLRQEIEDLKATRSC